MKSFMSFLSTVSINTGSPPEDILKPETHPILEKRGSTPKSTGNNNNDDKADNAAPAKNNNNGGGNNNNNSGELNGATAATTVKGPSPRPSRSSIGRSQTAAGEVRPTAAVVAPPPPPPPKTKADSLPAASLASQKENRMNNTRSSTIVDEKEQARAIAVSPSVA